MSVLVTGATGFIGGALVRELLADRRDVVVIVRDGDPPPGCTVVRGRLEDLDTCVRAVVEHRPEAVFHLAAQATVGVGKIDPWGTFEANVRGTYNLLEALRRHPRYDCSVVVASSDKAYGVMQGERPYTEDDPLQGVGSYDCSKSCTDLIAQSYAREFGLRLGVVRLGNVYGPGDTELSRIVPSVCDDLINLRVPVIRSDGRPIRDYLYIDDAVRAYLALERHLEVYDTVRGKAPAFNFSGGSPCSVIELVRTIIELACDDRAFGVDGYNHTQDLGRRLEELGPIEPRVIGERSGEIEMQVLDTTLARTTLGFSPSRPLKQGLARTLHWAWERKKARTRR